MAINVQNVNLKMTAGRKDQFPRDMLPQIALSGRSNVGKSSLINTLLGRKNFARTSSEPGKTITINFYEIDKKFYFVDLPGYGYARRSGDNQNSWSKLTNDYIMEEESLKLVIQLIDLKVGPTKDDYMMLDYLTKSGTPFIVVTTKSDKLNKTNRNANLEAIKNHPYLNPPYVDAPIKVIAFSALNGEGKGEVLSTVESMVLGKR